MKPPRFALRLALRSPHLFAEIARELRDNPMFVPADRDRWQLGSHVAP